MPSRLAPLALLALLAAGDALAQSAPPRPSPGLGRLLAEGVDIPEAEWRAMTEGRTVWYLIEGDVWGRESYVPGTARSTFQFPDGQCLEAVWTFDDPWFCFDFGVFLDDPVQCFRHLRWQGEIWVLGDTGALQKVDRIDASPLSCGPDVAS